MENNSETIQDKEEEQPSPPRISNLREACADFLSQDWKIIDPDSLQLKQGYKFAEFSRLGSQTTIADIFFKIFDDDLLEFMRDVGNKKTTAFQKRPFHISKSDMIQFLGVQMLMENTASKQFKVQKEHFKYVKKEFNVKMSFNKYRMIRSSFTPTLDELETLCQLLGKSSFRLLQSVFGITPDETMISYRLSKNKKQLVANEGEPYPHMFIPRKTIRNGMLIWTMATYVASSTVKSGKLPYFLVFVPHLRPNDGGSAAAVRKMLDTWPIDVPKPHIVADSGFGSFTLLKEITDWGGVATLSLPSNECQNLHRLLSNNLPLNNWRACQNSEGVIFSIYSKMVESASGSFSIGKKMVVSTAFTANSIDFQTPQVSISNSNSAVPMPQFTEETLKNMPVKSKNETTTTLSSICELYNIKKGKTKEDYIRSIMNRTKTLYSKSMELDQLEKFVKTEYFTGKSLLHDLYVARFNAVDLGDRYYSKVDDGHRVHDWHTKLWFALLKLGIVNCYVRSIQCSYLDWIDFRTQLAKDLVSTYDESKEDI